MGTFVVRLGDDQYVKWSNTVDAPVSPVLTRSELILFLEAEDQVTFSQAEHLLTLADHNGTSDPHTDLESLLATNRAGSEGQNLSIAEIIQDYRRTE